MVSAVNWPSAANRSSTHLRMAIIPMMIGCGTSSASPSESSSWPSNIVTPASPLSLTGSTNANSNPNCWRRAATRSITSGWAGIMDLSTKDSRQILGRLPCSPGGCGSPGRHRRNPRPAAHRRWPQGFPNRHGLPLKPNPQSGAVQRPERKREARGPSLAWWPSAPPPLAVRSGVTRGRSQAWGGGQNGVRQGRGQARSR